MDSILNDKEISKKILELIDNNKHDFQENIYIKMCNFMKSKFNNTNTTKPRRRFASGERLLYNFEDIKMKWCEIIMYNDGLYKIILGS